MVFIEIVEFLGIYIVPILVIIAIILMVYATVIAFQAGEKVVGILLLFFCILLIIGFLAIIEKLLL